jgi:leucyl-tRNA synthetase
MRHHLYARFITRALHDQGLLPFSEPFPRLHLHGMLTRNGAKISKSRGNVINPDEYIAAYGADVTRMYLLFIGPWDEGGDFSDSGISGIERFLKRVWRLANKVQAPGPGNVDMQPLDRAVAAVRTDLEELKFNTAIASLMEGVRWAKEKRSEMSNQEWTRAIRTIVLMLGPFAPHLSEELWRRIGGPYSVHQQAWPEYDERALEEEWITLVIQVNGKVRDTATVRAGLNEDEAVAQARASAIVRQHIGDGAIQRVVFVPDRLINLVV